MRNLQALDWIVLAVWIWLSLWIGSWLVRGFYALVGFGVKSSVVVDALHERVQRMRGPSPR